jgi:hypothetical protein
LEGLEQKPKANRQLEQKDRPAMDANRDNLRVLADASPDGLAAPRFNKPIN